MTILTEEYLATHAVHFEPRNEDEVRAVQRHLLDLGYSWGVNQRTISYVAKSLADGITALPSKRLFIGIPSGVDVEKHGCEELGGVEFARVMIKEIAKRPDRDASAIEDLRRELKRDIAALRSDMFTQFELVARRQKAIEDNQISLMRRLDEVLALLQPRVDLGIKKPGC